MKSRFARAVDALCLSREDVARALDLAPALLEAYARESLPVPPMVELQLVDLLKLRESTLGTAAGSLYDEAMFRLESSGLSRPVTSTDPPSSSPPSPPPPPSPGGAVS